MEKAPHGLVKNSMEFLTREVAFNMYERKIDDEKQAKELSVQKSKQPIFYTTRYFMWSPIYYQYIICFFLCQIANFGRKSSKMETFQTRETRPFEMPSIEFFNKEHVLMTFIRAVSE
jgi:hypothetical protein